MDPKTWQRIDRIFHAAVNLDAAARDAFLDEQCADDPEVRREVESLLAHSGDEATRIEGAVLSAVAHTAAETGGVAENDRLGPYRILREVGRGGSSTVYLAERADGQFEMQVAIKVLSRGLAEGVSLQRLEQERRILARLDHPNISRLLDAGATPDGLPYVVMEYIEGEDLESYCNGRSLPIRERLELFIQVCSAVEVAHRNLVIHRDIKPANLWVNADGAPKLLDFGISKLLTAGSVDPLSAPTVAGERPMTPLFASPEQVQGDPLTTATDVYSLGVVLYRLVTGAHPYPIDRADLPRLESMILEAEPAAPSSRWRDEAARQEFLGAGIEPLPRPLAGELDAIVLKALRKERERRYASPGQLGDDLRRLLDGRPVQARPDTVGYRLRKLVRRHRLAAAAIAATAIAILALITFYTARLADERDRAQRSAQEAAQVSDMMVRLFELADPDKAAGETVTARELLDRGATRIEGELDGQPQVQAALFRVVGRAYSNLGLYLEAQDYLERSLSLTRDAEEAAPEDLAQVLGGLGEVLYVRGEHAAAEEMFRETLNLARREFGETDERTLSSYVNLGAARFSQGDLAGAEASWQEAYPLQLEALGPEHPNVAATLNNLATLLALRGEHEAAEELLLDALARRRKVSGDLHPGVAAILTNLADFAVRRGDDAVAEGYYQEALAINRQAVGTRHPVVVHILEEMGRIARRAKRYPEAEEHLREALALQAELQPPDPGWAADLRAHLAQVALDQGRCPAAVTWLEPVAATPGETPEKGPRAEALRRLADCETQ